MSDFSRFSRPTFYQESEDQLSDDKELTVGDLELEEPKTDDNGKILQSGDLEKYKASDEDVERARGPIEELPGYMEDRMSDDDLNKFKETEDMDPDDVTLGSFGTDTSDVHNDYDPKDVETLRKLMASEADALGEYLDAAKETNTDVLRRLYADIGNEERFHMEQLLFAKSELTGEKYVPKDPEVKSEYEELLAMGMDEETAMQTAVDKCHIRVSVDSDDDDFEKTADELQEDVKNLQETFELIQITTNIILESYEQNKISPYVTPIMESTFYQEAFGTADKNWDPTTSMNPFKLLGSLIGKAITFILNTVAKFRKMFNQIKNRASNARAFIKEHGYAAIFQQGVHLYFEPQQVSQRLVLNPVIWKWYMCVWSLHDLCVATLKNNVGGLNINQYQPPASIGKQHWLTYLNDATVLNCQRNIPAGIQVLDRLDITRTKIPTPTDEASRETWFEGLTGYTGDEKNFQGTSNNYINQIYMLSDVWKHLMVTIQGNVNAIANQKEIAGSAYNKNPSKNDIAYKGLKACVDACTKFCKCCTNDIVQIANICKQVYQNTVASDKGDIEAGVVTSTYTATGKKNGKVVKLKADQLNKNYEDLYAPTRNATIDKKK